MKLSEAMLQGTECHPQAFGTYFERKPFETTIVATCALASAYEAVNGCITDYNQLPPTWVEDINQLFPCLNERVPSSKVENYQTTVLNEIVHRNDREHQTREEIAAWLTQLGY